MSAFLQKHQKAFFLTLLALVSLGAGWYIADCTKYAPWGFSDSAAYLSAARNFAAGRGLGLYNPDGGFAPLMIFAPFYSVFLSFFALLKVDLVIAARLMDIVFFAALVAASGWLLYLITRSFWTSLCFAVMITTTPALGVSFTSIMSDPLAMVLGIPGFLLLIYALKENLTKWLILSAILAALALLTRYAFVAFPAAGVLCILLLSNKPLRGRVRDLLKYAVISFTPMLVWVGQQLLSKNSVGSRTYSMDFSFTEKTAQFASQVVAVLKYWLPYRTNMIPGVNADLFRPILLLFFAAVIGFGLYLSLKKPKTSERGCIETLTLALVVVITAYLAVLLVIYSVSTEIISIDDRMLAPLIPAYYGLLLTCALLISRIIHPRITIPLIGILIAAFFVVFNTQPFMAYPIVVGNYPNGYTFSTWKENPILTGEVILPQDRPLITNAPDILLFYTNRSAYTLSAGDLSSMDVLIHTQCAVLVLFDPTATQRFEQLPDAVSSADVAALQSQLDTLHASAYGVILADNKCSR